MNRRQITITVPASQVQRLDEIADATKLARSVLVEQALSGYLKPKRTRRQAAPLLRIASR